MIKKKARFITLPIIFLIISITVISVSDTMQCIIVAGYYNVVRNVDTKEIGFKKPFFLVLEPPKKEKYFISYSGLHYWNGYSVTIRVFPNENNAREFFIKQKTYLQKYNSTVKESNMYLEDIDSMTFIQGYTENGSSFCFELYSVMGNNAYQLSQVSKQNEYRNKATATELLRILKGNN